LFSLHIYAIIHIPQQPPPLKKHDFPSSSCLENNGTAFAVQNPRIGDIEKQVEQEVQLVSRLAIQYEIATLSFPFTAPHF